MSNSFICTEPHKRIIIPDWDYYHGNAKFIDGFWFWVSNSGRRICKWFSEKEKQDKLQIVTDAYNEMYHTLYADYLTHQREFPEYYVQTYEEANWVHRALYRGFKNRAWGSDFINPYDGWFGCNVLFTKDKSPDVELFRDKKVITLSLQGLYTKPTHLYREIWNKVGIRYICFTDKDEILHESWTGELPTQEFIEEFIL